MNKWIIVLIALAAAVFSIPAGAEMNETQDGGGGNGTYPPEWIATPTPVETATSVPEPTPEPEETPTAVPPPVETPAYMVEIRGEVVDAATQVAPFIWTGQNFAGLYYDVDRDLMSDSLTSTVTVPNTIESGDLAYTTYRVESCYANPEIGEYFAIGWFGERYMAVNGKPYLVSPIIFEMGKSKKTLAAGDEWDIGNGYSLIVMWIDLDANEVLLSLLRDDTEVASSVIQPHETGDWFGNCMYIHGFPGAYTVTMWDVPTTSTFVYQEDVRSEADVPIFSVYVDAIFRGTVTNLVQLKYAMLIDDDPVSVIETGAGMMEAEMVTPESVRLVNNKRIKLYMDSDTKIAEDLRIHVAGDSDGNGVNNYRYYPYVNRACTTPDPGPTPTPTPRPADAPVEVRGGVVEPASVQTGDIVWNASNFAAFWYDLDGDLMTETLMIASGTLSDCDRTIEERQIEYVIETMEANFDYSGWGKYDAMSFMAETYFAGYGANTSSMITGETISLVSNGMLSKVLIDEDDKHTISTCASLELHEGYEIKIIQLDVSGDKALIELFRNGKSVDTSVIDNTPETYVYIRDIGVADDVPIIAICVNSIYCGTESDMIVINGIFQISENYISVKPGDNYGEMEIVSVSSDPVRTKKIRMENYDDIDLSEGKTIDLMGNIKLIVADNETLRFAPVAELTEPGTYEVRGAVHSPDASQSAAIVWNASNFAAFWYEIDSDVATETLKIAPGTLSGFDRTINENDLVYATHPICQGYGLYENEGLTVDGHEGYLAEGWVGRQCVAINGSVDRLCELLVEFEDTDKKTLATGEKWDLGGGFALTAMQIDLEGDKVWFSLCKDGKELDSEVISCGSGADYQDHVYTYTADIGGEDDVPVFTCYVSAIFRGTDSNIVQAMYVFLIDDDVLEIGTGDRFGCMEVVTVSSAGVLLKNDEAIDLDSGTTKQIMEKMFFKVANNDTVRFYPFVERTIRSAVPAPEEEFIPDSDGDGVPDLWDKEADTPAGYWVNSGGIGRKWGDMNGDDRLTSTDALMLLQAVAGKIGL